MDPVVANHFLFESYDESEESDSDIETVAVMVEIVGSIADAVTSKIKRKIHRRSSIVEETKTARRRSFKRTFE